MKKLKTVMIAGLMAAGTVAGAAGTAMAASSAAPNFPSAAVLKINSDGFRTCKAMGDNGYTAIARGTLGDGGGGVHRGGFRYFQVKTCFETQAQCNHFINRIHHRISQIYELKYTNCKSRA